MSAGILSGTTLRASAEAGDGVWANAGGERGEADGRGGGNGEAGGHGDHWVAAGAGAAVVAAGRMKAAW